MIQSQEKIKVFISSACGDGKEKYNSVRSTLKDLLESTNLTKVYLFESEGASTYTARQHYTYRLEDCDICIFLIDNYDGIPDGVQSEIDTAKKHSIKSLYYFCDEKSKEKTPFEKSIRGAGFSKSKTVSSFEDFSSNGAEDLIEDLVNIYKDYCVGRLQWVDNNEQEESTSYPLTDSYFLKENLIKKNVVKNIDGIRDYFSKMILRNSLEIKKTNELDELCVKFLYVMFNNKTIEEFNLSLLLREIKKEQVSEHYEITVKRWDAIQEYFLGNLAGCVSILKDALKIAKENNLPEWLIKDILIDLRNQSNFLNEESNNYDFNNEFQSEIIDSNSFLNYPLIDRFHSDYYEKILETNIKNKIKSPNTISFGHDLNTVIDDLSSIFVISIVNGSLTHLQLLYDDIKLLSFYCCEMYSDWHFRTLLIKTTIAKINSKEIDNIKNHFDDLICKMDCKDAKEIYDFSKNQTIRYRRVIGKLEAIGVVGYFMDNKDFDVAWKEVFLQINDWIKNSESNVATGDHIYRALKNIYLRVNQDDVALICYKSLKSKKYRFFDEIFNLMYRCININELSDKIRIKLLDEIITIISEKEIRINIYNINSTLYTFRNQNKDYTEELDKAIEKYMPKFYNNDYMLEVNEEMKKTEEFIEVYLLKAEERNISQGRNGSYGSYGRSSYITIKNILNHSEIELDNKKIDNIFKVACSTLLKNTQTIQEKCEAIELLVHLCKKDNEILYRNSELIMKIKQNKKVVESGHSMMSNLRDIHLHLSALLLYSSFEEEIYIDFIENLSNINDDIFSQIHASKSILYFLESNKKEELNNQLESIILQNVLKWINSDSKDVRWYSIRILFSLLRSPRNHKVICNQLVKRMDCDNVYIKNSILKKIDLIKDIDLATYNYILQKASIDSNYVVRKVYKDIVDRKEL